MRCRGCRKRSLPSGSRSRTVRRGMPAAHSGLGAGALGAALAVKAAMEEHGLKGTIRLYGTPAEETVIGKVYMTLDGVFDDLDVCLHWHPGDENSAWSGSSKALVSAKFTFRARRARRGQSAFGRSALDAVELMNVGANFMREHVKEDARCTTSSPTAAGAERGARRRRRCGISCGPTNHEDVEQYFRWLRDIAEGAAKMTRTKMTCRSTPTATRSFPTTPLSELLTRNLERIGPPKFSPKKKSFARRIAGAAERNSAALPDGVDDRGLNRWPRAVRSQQRLDRRGRHQLAGADRRAANDLLRPEAPATVGRMWPASAARSARRAFSTRPRCWR
jgi:aminobenzoyl-glutamate utilization protein B